MCDLKICRICLRTECKFYKYDQLPLKFYYEEVMSLKSKEDLLPKYFCYECAALLHKFHKFKEKCFYGHNMLQHLLFENKLNYMEVRETYRKSKLKPPFIMNLSIIKVSKHVKTYNHIYDGDDEWEDEVEIYISDKTYLTNDDHDLDEKNEATKKPSDLNLIEVKNECNDVKNASNDLDDNDFDDNAFFDDMNDTRQTVITENKSHEQPQISTPISSDDEVLAKKVQHKPDNTVVITEPVTKKVPKFQRVKKGYANLNGSNWKKINLTDEEAMLRFEAKATDSKYVNAPSKCTLCYRWFSKSEIYNRHMILVHNQSLPQECRFCKNRFKLLNQLQRHLRQHYNLFECQRCYFVCNLEQSAVFHDESHNGKIRTCKICSKEFTHSSTYYSHMTTHRTNFICTLCGRSFVSSVGLDIHKKRTHVDYQKETSKPDSEAMYCQRCDIKFEFRTAYEEHLFHSANHTGDIVDVNNDLQRFQKKLLGVKEKAVITEEIRSRSEKYPTLVITKPMKRVTQGKRKTPMNCYQCGEHFESQMQCRKHHLAAHPRTTFVPPGAPERTICEVCGAALAFSSMMAHLKMHSRENLYKCDICQRNFVQNSTLKRHMLVHTGEKPFACTMCEKSFTQGASRALHIRTVHLKQPHPKRNRRKKQEFHCEDGRSSE